jgi:hypothetical protein
VEPPTEDNAFPEIPPESAQSLANGALRFGNYETNEKYSFEVFQP